MTTELDSREAAFQEQIEGLRRQFLHGLPDRRAALAAAWRECADAGDEAPWQRLRDVAHRLSGSAPCYGLDGVGELARDLDRLLSGHSPCRQCAAAEGTVTNLAAALDAVIASA